MNKELTKAITFFLYVIAVCVAVLTIIEVSEVFIEQFRCNCWPEIIA